MVAAAQPPHREVRVPVDELSVVREEVGMVRDFLMSHQDDKLNVGSPDEMLRRNLDQTITQAFLEIFADLLTANPGTFDK